MARTAAPRRAQTVTTTRAAPRARALPSGPVRGEIIDVRNIPRGQSVNVAVKPRKGAKRGGKRGGGAMVRYQNMGWVDRAIHVAKHEAAPIIVGTFGARVLDNFIASLGAPEFIRNIALFVVGGSFATSRESGVWTRQAGAQAAAEGLSRLVLGNGLSSLPGAGGGGGGGGAWDWIKGLINPMLRPTSTPAPSSGPADAIRQAAAKMNPAEKANLRTTLQTPGLKSYLEGIFGGAAGLAGILDILK